MTKQIPPIYPIYVTVSQASTMLRLSKTTIYKLIKTGQLVKIKIGSASRIPTLSVVDFALAALACAADQSTKVSELRENIQDTARQKAAEMMARLCNIHTSRDSSGKCVIENISDVERALLNADPSNENSRVGQHD